MRLGDLDALKKAIEELEITEELVDYDCDDVSTTGVSQYLDRPDVLDLIDNAPTVDEWIPIKYRPMTSEERKEFAEHYGIEYCDTLEEKAFDCSMPEDRQRILISTLWGVDIDVADNDIDGEGFICYGLEGNGDWSGVIAWRPLPEPYKKGGAKE